MKKKILFVFHDSNPLSGATASMLEVVIQLSDSELYEVTVLLPDAKNGLHQILRALNISYIEERIYNVRYIKKSANNYINKLKSLVKISLNYSLALKLKLKLKKINYNLIYTNTSDVYVGAFLAKLLNVPHVWHIREFGIEDQSRDHFLGENNFYRLVSTSDKVVVISNALKNKLLSFYVPEDKLLTVYNDVTNKIGCFSKDYNYNNELSLLVVGTISEEKGHSFLVECIKAIKDKGLKVRLGIVGDDKTDYANTLKNEIAAVNCSDEITFLGYSSDVNRIRREYDIAIIASTAEAFGRVTVEAMHAKMIVVASNTGANPELVTHRENGFLFELGNVEQFSNIIFDIDRNRGLLESIGVEASIYSEQFSSHSAAKKVNSIISNLL